MSIWDRLRNYADDIHSDYNIHHVGLEWLREAAERGQLLEALLREAPPVNYFPDRDLPAWKMWHDRVQEALQDE